MASLTSNGLHRHRTNDYLSKSVERHVYEIVIAESSELSNTGSGVNFDTIKYLIFESNMPDIKWYKTITEEVRKLESLTLELLSIIKRLNLNSVYDHQEKLLENARADQENFMISETETQRIEAMRTDQLRKDWIREGQRVDQLRTHEVSETQRKLAEQAAEREDEMQRDEHLRAEQLAESQKVDKLRAELIDDGQRGEMRRAELIDDGRAEQIRAQQRAEQNFKQAIKSIREYLKLEVQRVLTYANDLLNRLDSLENPGQSPIIAKTVEELRKEQEEQNRKQMNTQKDQDKQMLGLIIQRLSDEIQQISGWEYTENTNLIE